ncbi:acyl-CoA reductase-like NAD-dependent aldehyde dehydrogenase [Actinocorallia herbida]|uniref:Acyl-CoA reductase-like NAD-dependent aldehyde dehydrogenase n=1 Tax=Actinocorallia herbida TaxID=58109 RepID=A0A3N1D1K1_9ACTN|nr:aldehyde dehydrogenase [Actinocorallia herbida]ROO87404.1 acyl-CoA reductase-like NAD-dependent aldehyde dehydrogenase [Actinocorallia herbida]
MSSPVGTVESGGAGFSARERALPLSHPDRLFIGGQWVAPTTSSTFAIIDPTTEELYYRVAEAGPEDMAKAIAAARTAFDRSEWPLLAPAERAEWLRKIADGLRRRAADASHLWTRQVGVLHTMSSASIERVGAHYDYYADLAADFPFEVRHRPLQGAFGNVVREPIGVVGAIVAWNTPMSLAAYKVAPALLAGCTIVLKAPPEAPGEAYVLAEVAEEIGLPAGVLNVLTADREVSEQLVRDPRVDKVAFTGSSGVGRRIASICGDRMARYTLELGGKSPAVIFDDYDLETAARSLADAECVLNGQVCSSLTRIIVSRHRHDEFAEALGAFFGSVRVGDPYDPASQLGPLAMERQRDRVESYIAKGLAEGGKLVTGGGRPDFERGFYIQPTVFSGVDNQATIAQEEIFGPVLSVIPADDEEHAIQLANETVFGLNATVFTNDVDRAYRAARRLRAGTVGHNGYRTDPRMGFGGFKQSGVGREGGRDGLLPYLESKTVILDEIPSGYEPLV